MSEANKKRLYELVSKPENSTCADCDHDGKIFSLVFKIILLVINFL